MPKALQKYWLLFQTSWQNQFTYRATLIVWRIRNLLGSFVALSVWDILFASKTELFGYNHEMMITYIFLIAIIQNFILSTSLHGLATRLYTGQISYQLIKPINLWTYLATEDLADKLKNFFFAILEAIVLYLIFQPALIFPSGLNFIIFLVWVGLGTFLNYVINVLFGAFGFWTPDIWGPKFLFFMLVEFTSGRLYPLSVLPKVMQNFFYLTPFPYLSYVQTQLFLKQFSLQHVVATTTIMVIWIVGLGLITQKVWRFGLKHYVAAGQ